MDRGGQKLDDRSVDPMPSSEMSGKAVTQSLDFSRIPREIPRSYLLEPIFQNLYAGGKGP
jgi:hypothetical protein